MKVFKELPPSIYHSLRLGSIPVSKLVNGDKPRIPVIVSLTSIPSRLPTLHIVIRSLMVQECLPKKIVLWLNNDLKNNLPAALTKLENDLFEIRYSELTCSHRKLIHSLEAFPNETIVTCDDDLIYDKNWLQLLYDEHQKNPSAIVGNRTVHINYDTEGHTKSYKEWRYPEKEQINPKSVMPIGAEGILYPAGSFTTQIQDRKLFMQLAPYNDDLWFKANSLINGTQSVQAKIKPKSPIPIIATQRVALKKVNVDLDRNRSQWDKLSDHFDLRSIIMEN